MTRSLFVLHDTPSHWHGVSTESDHELRTPVGSTSIAALRASSERPSELRHEVKGMKKQTQRRVMMLQM